MRLRFGYLLPAVVLVLSACSETPSAPGTATSAVAPNPPRLLASIVAPPAQCPTVAASQATVDLLLPQLFSPGQGRRGKAQGYTNNIVQARRNGNTQLEQLYVDSLVNYTLQTYYSGNLVGGQSSDTQVRVLTFFYALYCASSISPIPDLSGIFSAQNTVFISNGTPTTIVSTPLDDGAVKVDQGDVPATQDGQPFFGTFVSVYRTSTPLPTSLDWYGIDGYKQGAFEFVANPPVTFTDPVLTGVCITYDNGVVTSPSDLRLAHQVQPGYVSVVPGNYVVTTSGGTIEITAPLSTGPLGLQCDPLQVASRTVAGRALEQLAKLVLPGPLLAEILGGGIGGQAVTFSPFGAVDTKLNATGTGPSSPQYIPLGSTSITAPVSVSIRTRNPAGQTPIPGINVAFAPGTFAPASAVTDASGTAGSTWTLVAGTNTGTATPSQAPFTFSGSPVAFSVLAIQVSPVEVTTTSLPGAERGVPYSAALSATGGDGSYTWSVVGGSLPDGLVLSGATISGTPSATATTSTFTVQATSAGTSDTQVLTLTVGSPGAITLSFDVAPAKSRCYAVDVPMTPGIRVKVTDQGGNLLSGVVVSMVGVTNNGAKVEVTPSSAVSIGGFASFGGPTINKTGGYALIVSTGTPWPIASVTSAKFTISPSC